MLRHLDPALLRCFTTVVETGSMTRAAPLLHLSQAAISQQVRRLEEFLGTALLTRERQGLRLTAAGERLLPRAQRFLALNDEIWAAMTAPEVVGEVRCGVPHDIAAPLMPPVLKAFDRAWPQVEVSIVTGNTSILREALDRGELDLTLGTEQAPGKGGEILFTDRLLWVGAAGGTAWEREPIPVSLGDHSCAFRAPALKALAATGRAWRPAFTTHEMAAIAGCVGADLTIAMLLASTIPPGLAPVPAAAGLPDLPPFHVTLYERAAGQTPAAAALAGLLRQRLGVTRVAA